MQMQSTWAGDWEAPAALGTLVVPVSPTLRFTCKEEPTQTLRGAVPVTGPAQHRTAQRQLRRGAQPRPTCLLLEKTYRASGFSRRLMNSMASSTLFTVTMGRTGPKISSSITFDSADTSVRIVGAEANSRAGDGVSSTEDVVHRRTSAPALPVCNTPPASHTHTHTHRAPKRHLLLPALPNACQKHL